MNKNELCCSVVSDLNGNVSRLLHVNVTCGVKGHYKSRDGTITTEALKRRRRSKVYFSRAWRTQQHRAVI